MSFIYFIFLTTILSTILVNKVVVSGDAAATAHNILAHESLFRFGVITGLVSTAFYIA